VPPPGLSGGGHETGKAVGAFQRTALVHLAGREIPPFEGVRGSSPATELAGWQAEGAAAAEQAASQRARTA